MSYASVIDKALPSLKDQALHTRLMLNAHDFIKAIRVEAEKLDVPTGPKMATVIAVKDPEPPADLFGALPPQ